MGNAEVTLSAKLQLIATIQPGQTIAVKTMTVMNYGYWGRTSRWWNAESRLQTLNWVTDIVTEALTKLKTGHHAATWQDLKAAQAGIRNLEKTYGEDAEVKRRVAIEIERIDAYERECPIPPPEEKKTSPEPNSTPSRQEKGDPQPNAITLEICPAPPVGVDDSSGGETKIPSMASLKQLDSPPIEIPSSPVASTQPIPLSKSYRDALLSGESKKKQRSARNPGPHQPPYSAGSQPRPIPKSHPAAAGYSHTYPTVQSFSGGRSPCPMRPL